MNAADVIRELVEASLISNREFDGVGFIDRLLAVASEVGQIRAALAAPGVIRFQPSGHAACEVPVERAKDKLRMLCARLAVLCQQSGGQDFILYGGEGVIHEKALAPAGVPAGNGPALSSASTRPSARCWSVRLKNTTDEQEFTITAN